MANMRVISLTHSRHLAIVRQIYNTGLLDHSEKLHHNTPNLFRIVLSLHNYLRTTMNGTWASTQNGYVPGETIVNAHLNIFSLFVSSHNLYNKVGNVCRKGLLGDMFDERAKLHWQTLLAL